MVVFAGLWCCADRNGMIEYRPARLKAEIIPYWGRRRIERPIEALRDAGFIEIFSRDGVDFIAVKNFKKHQRPHPSEKPNFSDRIPTEYRPSTDRCVDSGFQVFSPSSVRSQSICNDKKPEDLRGVSSLKNLSKTSDSLILNTDSLLPQPRPTQPAASPTSVWLEKFLAAYPNSIKVDLAVQTLLSLGADTDARLQSEIDSGLQRWLESEDWKKDGGKYIPAMHRWVSDKRWKDKPRKAGGTIAADPVMKPFDPEKDFGEDFSIAS